MQGMASILLWMFTKPHTVVSFPDVALCEVNYRPQGNGGALSKHNANKKFMFRNSGVIQYLLQKILCVRETVIFSFLFFSKKKERKLLCDQNIFRIIFRMFYTICVVMEDQNQ